MEGFFRLLLWLPLTWLATACTQMRDDSPARAVDPITDGTRDSGHPAVGQLRGGGKSCTATLIASRTVVTAAHCVDPASSYQFSLDSGGDYSSTRVVRHPAFDPGSATVSENDLAVV